MQRVMNIIDLEFFSLFLAQLHVSGLGFVST